MIQYTAGKSIPNFVYDDGVFRSATPEELSRRPKEKESFDSSKARVFKIYPLDEEEREEQKYDIFLAEELCKKLELVNATGTIKKAAKENAFHIICNYRYRALKKNSKKPEEFLFHYSRSKSKLIKSISGVAESFLTFLNDLERNGFIKNNIQEPVMGSAINRESTFHFTDQFVTLISALEEGNNTLQKPEEEYRPPEYGDGFFIKVKENYAHLNKVENKKAQPTYASLDEKPAKTVKKAMNRVLKSYNELLNQTEFKLIGKDHCDFAENDNPQKVQEDHSNFQGFDIVDNIKVCRQFADPKLKTHGRFYGGFWQRMPKDLRKYLTINNANCFEFDFCSLQPNIMFSKAGAVPLYPDLYHVPYYYKGENRVDETKAFDRQVIKDCFVLLVNSKRSNSFINTIHRRMKDDCKSAIDSCSSYLEAEEEEELNALYRKKEEWESEEFRILLRNSLERAWQPIWNMFGSDNGYDWRTLTKLDSDITYHIVKEMTAQNIPVLTIHDSYIVRGGSEQILLDAMGKAYKEVIGAVNDKLPELHTTRVGNKGNVTFKAIIDKGNYYINLEVKDMNLL